MAYQMRNLRTFRGRQGHGYTAELVLDGRKVADVEELADGGAPRVEFATVQDTAALMADIAPGLTGNDAWMALEAFLAKLADDADLHDRAVKMIRSKVLFTLDGRRAVSIKAKPTQDAFDLVRKTHPTARFLRDMPEAEAVKLLTGGA